MTDRFKCPERANNPQFPGLPEDDHWRSMPDGSRTCSYCGSLHPEDYLDILEKFGASEPGYRVETTTKGYKIYANRPGVTGAGQGGIKMYGWHLSPEQCERQAVLWPAAAVRLSRGWAERWGVPE